MIACTLHRRDGPTAVACPVVLWELTRRRPRSPSFFIAFFPQFIHPADGAEVGQVLVLGTLFWSIGAIWDLAFAYASVTIGARLHRRPRLQAAQPRAEGLAYLCLAGWAALTSSRSA